MVLALRSKSLKRFKWLPLQSEADRVRFQQPRHIKDSQDPILAHIRQSRPDSGLGFQVTVLKTLQVVPASRKRELLSRVLALEPAGLKAWGLGFGVTG